MNRSVLKTLLALAAVSACAAAYGANVYESHIDIYRSLSPADEAFNAPPAPTLKRVTDEKKVCGEAGPRRNA